MATRNSNPNSKRVFRERNNQKSEKIPSKDRKIKIEIRLSNRFGKTLSDTHLKIDQPLKKKRATTPINKTILKICADLNRL